MSQPYPGGDPALFRTLLERVQLILLTAEAAQALPPDLLRRTQAAERPLVLVIPDVRGASSPDRVALVRRQLGMAE